MSKSFGRTIFVLITMTFFVLQSAAFAQSSGTQYKVEETFFGTGGELDPSSTNYKAKQSAGELGVGNTAGTSFQAFAGFNTTDEPFLEFVVNASSVDIGVLSASTAATTTGSFYVRAWQAGGYVVRTESDPPSYGASSIDPMTSGGASAPGTEQFGINLVANTSPVTFGSNPQQSPDGTFAFGQVATGYSTANQFRYNKGEVIAESLKSSSVTIYTISYLYNISSFTPAGLYTFNHNLVATATY